MGIRFHCPNCQRRLNVKITQVGQLGQCPRCRETVKVPAESSIKESVPVTAKENSRSTQKVAAGQDEGGSSKSHLRFSLPSDLPEDAFDDPSAILDDADDQDTLDGPLAGEHESVIEDPAIPSSTEFRASAYRTEGEAFMLSRPSPATAFEKGDPIQEAPKMVWFFRTRGFGERGPIKPIEMQAYLSRGDVQVGSMVWREDWDDWVEAEEVFPALAEQAKLEKQQARLARAISETDYELPEMPRPLSPEELQKQRQKRIYLWMTIAGLGVVGVLVMILLQILPR